MESSFRYLSHEEVEEVHKAAIDLRLARSRTALLEGIDPSFIDELPTVANPSEQLLVDLGVMAKKERLKDGSIPLKIWLSSALRLRSSAQDSEVAALKDALAKVKAKAGETAPLAAAPPAPPPPARDNPPDAPLHFASGAESLQKAMQPTVSIPVSQFPRTIVKEEHKMLTDALSAAYPERAKLRMMLMHRLGKQLNNIVAENVGATQAAFELIEAAKADGWLLDLVKAARASSNNHQLIEFCQHVGLAPGLPSSEELNGLQSFLRSANDFLDVDLLRSRLGEVEAQVCRIEVKLPGPTEYGTGFLVGPDLVITNYHVLKPVIDGDVPPSDVTLRFDYKRLGSGQVVSQGRCFALAPIWNVDSSPFSNADVGSGVPSEDELDYALVRVAGKPGESPVGEAPEPGAPHRRWVVYKNVKRPLEKGDPLFIVQHPKAEPIKVALDTNAILSVNTNGTRVRYVTNTKGGSSGSPCFNANWELVALHHWGDPDRHDPKYNQGIPFDKIVARLAAKGITLPPLPASAAH